MNRIISKEEEREDPRKDSSIYLRVQWCFHIPTRTTRFLRIQCILQCFYMQSSKFPVIPCHSTYRINSSPRNTTTTRLIPCRLLPATVPHVSKHSTRQNKASGPPYKHSKAIQYKQASSNSTRQKQHSTRQPASTQSLQQFPGQVLHHRILPGEIGFIPKG